jgi:hypothetical protein
MYHAPDADVLLDENFPRGYCFALAPRERDRATQVGLAFAPMQRNRRITSVDGTLWIDTAARRLVDLEYRYLVDGQWRDDPNCQTRVPNTFGGENCVRVVA